MSGDLRMQNHNSRGMHGASPGQRLAYEPPQLSVLGDVGSLTETGSMNGMEDFFQNGMCFFPNSTFNMC